MNVLSNSSHSKQNKTRYEPAPARLLT